MDSLYPVALSLISHANFRDSWEIIKTLDPEEIYNRIKTNTPVSLQQHLAGLYPPDPLDAAELIIEKCYVDGIKILHLWDSAFPVLLSLIHRPPLVFYQKGNGLFNRCIAIVGTRKADPISLRVTDNIVSDIITKGCCIVSGMAIGIDRQAHLSALKAEAPTIGVLAQGIDRIYPQQNMDIFERILTSVNSCLVSEYPPGSRADKWTFARRNRIISGLCLGTVVVKAGEKSGAMITARHAIEQNREVFACPGHAYDPAYDGCHSLIRSGAVLVSCGDDIITEIMPSGNNVNNRKIDKILDKQGDLFMMEQGKISGPDNKKASYLWSIIPLSGIDIDDLGRISGFPADEMQQLLVEMELDGLIERQGSMCYRN